MWSVFNEPYLQSVLTLQPSTSGRQQVALYSLA